MTANRHFLDNDVMTSLSEKYSKTPAEIFFAFTKALNIIPLSGTKNEIHMSQDLKATDNSFVLNQEEIELIQKHLIH